MNYKIEPIKYYSYPIRLPNRKKINFKNQDQRAIFLHLWSIGRNFSNERINEMIEIAKRS